AFAALYDTIDATTSTSAKVSAMVAYLRSAPPADCAWAIAFLLGRRPKRLVRSTDLRMWAAQAADIPDWLFEESYTQAGDLAETITLLVPEPAATDDAGFADWVEGRLLPLAGLDAVSQRAALLGAWSALAGTARFVFNKLITGSFRVGVSDGLVVRAIAQASGVDADVISHRLMGQWEPSGEWYARLVAHATDDADWSRPYPFYLAYPLEEDPASLGAVGEWQAEWKWDGIRAQIIRRRGRTFIWSRGEELLAGRFPEIEESAAMLPDGTVIDGEIVAWGDGRPRPFTELQRRLNRKTVGKALLAQVPCRVLAYDVLEIDGRDVRTEPLDDRRRRLDAVVAALPTGVRIALSPTVDAASWNALADARGTARVHEAEGLMLKRRSSVYGVGRRVGDWYKWKVAPYTIDAVLTAAQGGHGRRAGLYTDYTFGVWDGDVLVTVAKAYSGLTDAEIREVDRFVRANTREKFGPVRTVEPLLVFELAFEALQPSTRHKSGIAVRFPRIARWRRDKTARDADSLETIRAMLASVRATATDTDAAP
nr:ATP-dependent DNA ligase [Gemmatimonadaceae bacterium]